MAELGSSEIAPVHAKTLGNAVPTDGANVGGQNSSSHLSLGSEPHVRALACLGTKWENDTRFTVVRPIGLRPPSFFLLIIGPHYNKMRRPFHRLHGK